MQRSSAVSSIAILLALCSNLRGDQRQLDLDEITESRSLLRWQSPAYRNYALTNYVQYPNHTSTYEDSPRRFFGFTGNHLIDGYDLFKWSETRQPGTPPWSDGDIHFADDSTICSTAGNSASRHPPQVGVVSQATGECSTDYTVITTGTLRAFFFFGGKYFRDREMPRYSDFFIRLDHEDGEDVSTVVNLPGLLANFTVPAADQPLRADGDLQAVYTFDLSREPRVESVEVEALVGNDYPSTWRHSRSRTRGERPTTPAFAAHSTTPRWVRPETCRIYPMFAGCGSRLARIPASSSMVPT